MRQCLQETGKITATVTIFAAAVFGANIELIELYLMSVALMVASRI